MKRCFIENDLDIIDFDREFFESKTGVPFDSAFDIIILEASDNKDKVWTAINECGEIWMSTSFVGESDRLLSAMLEMGLKHNIRDKVVVNLNEYKDAAWHLSDENRKTMWAMEETHNVKFVFKDNYEEFKQLLQSFAL